MVYFNRGGGRAGRGGQRNFNSNAAASSRIIVQAAAASAASASMGDGSLSSRFRTIQDETRKGGNAVQPRGGNPKSGSSNFPHRSGPSVNQRIGHSSNRGGQARVQKPGNRAGFSSSKMMVDSGSAAASAPARRGRGGAAINRNRGGGRAASRASPVRGGRGGRSVSGRGRGGASRPMSRDKLDADLENYMMKDVGTARTILDSDLDSYMKSAPLH